jgi:hypothetical protein
MNATNYDNPECGLYVDAGFQNAAETDMRVIGIAESYGWTVPEDATEDNEWINEIADEAIEYLNSLEQREGYWWGYGDNAEGFGLWCDTEE